MESAEIKKTELPNIGIGTSHMKNIDEVIYQSIVNGVKLIDTASMYKNEEDVGKAINRAINDGIVKREDLFIVTKFWLNEKEDPEKALKASLKRLNLNYVDLYLDHWPSGKCYNGSSNFKLISVKEYWPKLEKLVDEGLTKHIGVSNYNVQNLLIALSIAKIKPLVNEVEFHPYLYQKDLLEFCNLENIKIIAYNPLVKGSYCKERHGKIMEQKKLDLFNEISVQNLSKKYGKTPGQIILNWEIHRGVIPIPGTSRPERMKENLDAENFKMEENEYDTLDHFAEQGKEFRFFDSKGGFNIQELRNQNARAFNSKNRPNLRYPFFVDENDIDKNGFCKVFLENHKGLTEVWPITTNGYESVWRWGKNEKAKQFLDELIARRGDDGIVRIYQKMRKLTEIPKSVLINKDYLSIKGTRELETLLGRTVFDFPKPTALISLLLRIGSKQDSLIVDFFSGSATTAHSVMQLNADDNGKRRYILIQIPEKCIEDSEARKIGYRNVSDIGQERIRRAGKKICDVSYETKNSPDIGFRVFRVDSSNMKDVYYRPQDFEQGQMNLFADNIKEDRTPEDLLFQVMLDLGIMLSSKIEETTIAGKKVFSVEDGYLIACFDKDVTDETVEAIAKQKPFYAVFRDSGMINDSVMTNFEQIFETYSPKTQGKGL